MFPFVLPFRCYLLVVERYSWNINFLMRMLGTRYAHGSPAKGVWIIYNEVLMCIGSHNEIS
jgi:hypothetical protein